MKKRDKRVLRRYHSKRPTHTARRLPIRMFELKHPHPVNADTHLLQPHGDHARELFALIQNNLTHLNQWLSWPALMKTPLDVAIFLNTAARHNRAGTALILLLQYQGKICGVLSYNDFQAHEGSANIGYWLGEAYQGHGIVSSALPVLVQYGFTQLGLKQVFIRVAEGNDKSAAIPKRLGFQLIDTDEGSEILHQQAINHHVYAMRQEDWAGVSAQ